jgi:hypothetical protein
MYKVAKYPHGTFSWAENTSTDPGAAEAFYMALFGWDKYDIPINESMVYTMFQLGGENVCALNGMMPDIQAQGIPSFWGNYVTVDDVDALAAPVKANGGTILVEPMDVFDSGRMAYIMDPTGAQLGLWQPKEHIGAGIVNTVGAMCWNELLTRDAETAKAFYSTIFGWEFYGDEHYIHISNRGRNNGGMMEMGENFGEMPPMWMVYFHVADIDAAMKRVEALGGKVVTQKMEAPDTGWFTVIEDPAGAVFYIMQLAKADPWIE